MKARIKLGIISAGLVLLGFSGCAHTSECEVNKCANIEARTDIVGQNTNVAHLKPAPVCKTESQPTCKHEPETCKCETKPKCDSPVLKKEQPLKLSVVGQGVAPCNGTCSPAQAYAMAKRAAIADAYRLIAEKVKGVYVEGEDIIRNMAIKRSTVRTAVSATIKNANVVETNFKDGLCEVEMEITLYHSDFSS